MDETYIRETIRRHKPLGAARVSEMMAEIDSLRDQLGALRVGLMAAQAVLEAQSTGTYSEEYAIDQLRALTTAALSGRPAPESLATAEVSTIRLDPPLPCVILSGPDQTPCGKPAPWGLLSPHESGYVLQPICKDCTTALDQVYNHPQSTQPSREEDTGQ